MTTPDFLPIPRLHDDLWCRDRPARRHRVQHAMAPDSPRPTRFPYGAVREALALCGVVIDEAHVVPPDQVTETDAQNCPDCLTLLRAAAVVRPWEAHGARCTASTCGWATLRANPSQRDQAASVHQLETGHTPEPFTTPRTDPNPFTSPVDSTASAG